MKASATLVGPAAFDGGWDADELWIMTAKIPMMIADSALNFRLTPMEASVPPVTWGVIVKTRGPMGIAMARTTSHPGRWGITNVPLFRMSPSVYPATSFLYCHAPVSFGTGASRMTEV